MFRCKECGTEYEEKPDYCDCGNDTFEEIKPAPAPQPKPAPAQAETVKPQPTPAPQIRTVRQEYNTPFNNPKSEIPKVKSSSDMISLGLFVLSIVLAVCTLFIFGNPKEEQAEQPEQTKTAQTTLVNIPNVDSYWDNSAVVVPQAQPEVPEVQPEQKQATDPITSKFDEWLNRPKRVADDTPKYTQPVQQTKPAQVQTKTTQPPKAQTQAKTNTATKPVSTNNPKINSPGAPNDLLQRVQNNIQFTNTQTPKTTTPAKTTTAATQTPKTTTATQKPITTTTTTTTQKPSTTTTTTAQTPPTLRNATPQNVKSQAEINREIANYKAALRNNIGKKINFANVIGDGNCAITFKVDSSGKLINRNFATKSSNITLNDAVYSAMMSTPSYNPPPEGYKSETMTLKVRIYDGNYEISLN